MNRITGLLAAAAACALASVPAAADEFYKGRQITITVGYGPGGGYDAYTRLVANHIGRHIPGNPGIVVQNMPGAGSMVAANHLANIAPKDGSHLGVFSAAVALGPLFGNAAAKYETTAFAWIGNSFRDVAACAVWRNSRVSTLDEMVKSDADTVFGASGAGTSSNQHALVLRNMLNAKIKVVTGYRGIRDIGLALEQGEIDAACGMQLSSVRAAFLTPFERGDLRVFVHFGRENVPFFHEAANFYDRLKTEEEKQVADLVFGLLDIARPIAGPPGMPEARTAILRKAMMDALADPALLAEAKRANIDIDPVPGDEVARMFEAFNATSPDIVKRVNEMLGQK